MWRVKNHHIKTVIPERHVHIVPSHIGTVFSINVQPNNGAFAAPPESPCVDGGIQNEMRLSSWVKIKHLLQEFRIFSLPNRCKGLII